MNAQSRECLKGIGTKDTWTKGVTWLLRSMWLCIHNTFFCRTQKQRFWHSVTQMFDSIRWWNGIKGQFHCHIIKSFINCEGLCIFCDRVEGVCGTVTHIQQLPVYIIYSTPGQQIDERMKCCNASELWLLYRVCNVLEVEFLLPQGLLQRDLCKC